jgi:hypothetical protein
MLKMITIVQLYSLISGIILLGACNVTQSGEPNIHQTYVEIPFSELVLEELDRDSLTSLGISGRSLADLRPFGWKTVDSGLVDIRTPKDYAVQVESLYQEGYLDYQQTRMEYSDRYQSIPEMSYEEFLATCNVFHDVDFSQYSVLGYHATGTGCNVTFERHVYSDEQNKAILYELTVVEEGICEKDFNNRNLILIPRIPSDYIVDFSKTIRKE